MKLKSVLIIVSILSMLAFFSHITNKNWEEHSTKYKQLSNKTALLEVNYLQEKEARKEALRQFEDERGKLYGTINSLTQENFKLKNKRRITDAVDLKGKQYIFHELHMVDRDGKLGPPIGYVMVYASGKVVSKIYNHEIQVNTVVTQNSDNQYRVMANANYILKQSGLANRKNSNKTDWNNKPYSLDIVSGTTKFVKENSKNKMHWIDPNIDLGINVLTNLNANVKLLPSLGISLASYGDSKRHDKYRFARLGVSGVSKDIDLNISPIMFNVGYKSNLFSNTFIYPIVGKYIESGDYSAGLGLSLGF